MKYSDSNPPLVCMQTQSKCYTGTTKMEIKGVLWHSTGCNSPYISRYVQPSDDAADREEWIEKLGKNKCNNDWNHTSRQAGLNCWVGKLADGTVTTVQTMPWNYRPWGCGSGSRGSCNTGWIQFEICEDKQTDENYFNAAYEEACQITAYLCKKYNLDPKGTTQCVWSRSGKEDVITDCPVILCHKDSANLKVGSDHSDIYTWFKKFGKDMTTVRERVAEILAEDESVVVKNGWVKDEDTLRWYYKKNGSILREQWIKTGKKYYYLMADGTMALGWIKNKDKWYYLNTPNGDMAKGWLKLDDGTFYLDPENGDMKTGKVEIDGKVYTFDSRGRLKE